MIYILKLIPRDWILNNLFDNAVRYNQTNGEINITVKCEKDHIHLSFANTGLKINKEHSLKIFDPFHQISHKKRSLQGIGMGLSIVKKIIEFTGGTISLENDCKLTTFKIIFPLSLPENSASVVSKLKKKIKPEEIITPKLIQNEYDEAKNTILVVDDNCQMLSFLIESLNPFYNVYWAEDGNAAFLLLPQIPKPDIILSDIMMDNVDGFQFITRLKSDSYYKSIPF